MRTRQKTKVLIENLVPFTIVSGATILQTEYPEPPWTVPDILPIGFTLFGGRPKVGKSWLALQIAHAKATGGSCFDRKVTQGRVLYIALDDNERRMKGRLLAQGWSKEDAKQIDIVTMGKGRQLKYLQDGGVAQIESAIKVMGYEFVVIDTMRRATRGLDPKDANRVQAVFEPMQEMTHALKCGIFGVDHNRKPGVTAAEDIVNDLIDSTAKSATADTLWGLYRQRGKKEADLQVTGKDLDEQILSLQFDVATRTWQSLGEKGSAMTPNQKECLKALQALGNRAQNEAIAKHLGKDAGNLSRDMKELVSKGKVKQDPKSKEFYCANSVSGRSAYKALQLMDES